MNVMNQVMNAVPAKLRMPFLLGGAGLLALATYFLIRNFPGPMWMAILVVTVGMALIVGVFKFIGTRVKRRKAAQAEGAIVDAARGAGGESDPEKIARAAKDDKAWLEGLENYRKYNGNGALADKPWILVAGEAGSGKTEAVRHSEISFAEGLKQRYQGTGGTLYMNWWFANDAIILDTAGRLMMPEHEQERTNREWVEFLRKLNRARPDCPINGMLLFIPATSLLEDSLEQISDKAGRIAAGLECIKSELGIRFPVYVVVSKCDKVKGFREFFAQLNDPILQHQILGWSNPAGLDDLFDPKQIDEHLMTVRERLRRRRLMLLLDPPHITGAGMTGYGSGASDGFDTATFAVQTRRIDHVDSLFIFPEEMMRVGPRLRLYVEKIFMPGPYTQHPPFVRGIYFTSSMQEGAELDAALAELMGVSIQEVPEVAGWRKDKAYFIKDVLTEKVFPEKGLVTRAVNAVQHYHRNKWVVNLVGAGALLLAVTAGLLAWLGVQRSVGEHADWWAQVAGATDSAVAGRGLRPIVKDTRFDGGPVVARVAREQEIGANMAQVLEKSAAMASRESEIRPPWWLAPVAHLLGTAPPVSGTAQQMTRQFAVEPLVRTAQSRLDRESSWNDEAAAALGETMRIEALAKGLAIPPPTERAFESLIRYASGASPDPSISGDLADSAGAFDWKSVSHLFPEARATPDVPSAMSAATSAMRNHWRNRIESPEPAEFANLVRDLRTYRTRENELLAVEGNRQDLIEVWRRLFSDLRDSKASIEQGLSQSITSIEAERQKYVQQVEQGARSAYVAASAWLPEHEEGEALDKLRRALRWTAVAAPDMPGDYRELDADYVALQQDRRRFALRFDVYQAASDALDRFAGDTPDVIEFARAMSGVRMRLAAGQASDPDSLMARANRVHDLIVERGKERLARSVVVPQLVTGWEALVRRHSEKEFVDEPPVRLGDLGGFVQVAPDTMSRLRGYDYRLMNDLRAGWQGIGEPAVAQAGYARYLTDYEDFWKRGLCQIDVHCGEWSDCVSRLDRASQSALENALVLIEDAQHTALDVIGKTRVRSQPLPPATVEALLAAWSRLNREPQVAKRDRLRGRTGTFFPAECPPDDCQFGMCFWAKLTFAAEKSIDDGIKRELEVLLAQLQPLLKFPLVCQSQEIASQKDIEDAAALIHQISQFIALGELEPGQRASDGWPGTEAQERWRRIADHAKWLVGGAEATITQWGTAVRGDAARAVDEFQTFQVESGRFNTTRRTDTIEDGLRMRLDQNVQITFGRLDGIRADPISFKPWELLQGLLTGCALEHDMSIPAGESRLPFWVSISISDRPAGAWPTAADYKLPF